jgi:phospholipid/cholesterol/gamma-HCH transport system ATP-binding protein
LIIFENITFSRRDKPVLKGISFSIEAGERSAIVGGSGEGKTTILKLIMGLIRPDSGSIIIDGEDITTMNEAQLREVRMKFSIVFQEGALFDSLTVGENVAFPLREYSGKSEEEIEQKVRELLRIVGMEDAIDLMPEELSGGMNRRAAIARSLAACQPKMFLYDEPTSALDPANANAILRLITDLSHGGRGFILVSHEVQNALRVADRFLLLKEGALLFDGDKETFLGSPVADIRAFASAVM